VDIYFDIVTSHTVSIIGASMRSVQWTQYRYVCVYF